MDEPFYSPPPPPAGRTLAFVASSAISLGVAVAFFLWVCWFRRTANGTTREREAAVAHAVVTART